MRSPGGRKLSFSACPGVGNRPPSEKKLQIPGGMPRGEMVTGRIEPCINFVYHSILVSRRRLFLLHYTSRILCSIDSRKAFKFLLKRLASLLYGNQYRHLYFVLAKQRICGQ